MCEPSGSWVLKLLVQSTEPLKPGGLEKGLNWQGPLFALAPRVSEGNFSRWRPHKNVSPSHVAEMKNVVSATECNDRAGWERNIAQHTPDASNTSPGTTQCALCAVHTGLEFAWCWNGVGSEMAWTWIGVGLDLDWSRLGLGLE